MNVNAIETLILVFVSVLVVGCTAVDETGPESGETDTAASEENDASAVDSDGGQIDGTAEEMPSCDDYPPNPEEGAECAHDIECLCGGSIASSCEYYDDIWNCPSDCGDQGQCDELPCDGESPGCWECGYDAPTGYAQCVEGEWACDAGEIDEQSCDDEDYS